MRMTVVIAGLLVMAGMSTGCISHNMTTDYPAYLAKGQGSGQLPTTGLKAGYVLTPATEAHKCKIRAASAGMANAWIVEFGKIFEMQLQSADVQRAFGKLARQKGTPNNTEDLITFDLEEYRFYNFSSHVKMKISLARAGAKSGTEAISRRYEATGKAQGGKVSWGGAFAMRNAIQQSTKLAIDEILASFIRDVGE